MRCGLSCWSAAPGTAEPVESVTAPIVVCKCQRPSRPRRRRDRLSLMSGNSDSLLRRTFLAASAGCLAGLAAEGGEDLRVLDIHQHSNYSGRSDDQLVAHQRKMGVTKTILLPSGNKPTPGLELGGTETCTNRS